MGEDSSENKIVKNHNLPIYCTMKTGCDLVDLTVDSEDETHISGGSTETTAAAAAMSASSKPEKRITRYRSAPSSDTSARIKRALTQRMYDNFFIVLLL